MAFAKDQDKNKILMLCRTGAKRSSENIEPRRFLIKIFDEDTRQIQVSVRCRSNFLQGLLTSGQFRLLDGHIYHKNMVIKVRYDLLNKEGEKRNLTCENLFDFFDENLPLRKGMRIASDAILICELRHKMAFIAQDIER